MYSVWLEKKINNFFEIAIAKKWKLDNILYINVSDRINGLLDNHKRLSDAVEALLGL